MQKKRHQLVPIQFPFFCIKSGHTMPRQIVGSDASFTVSNWLINPPRLRLKRTSWYISDHYICLQDLFLLSLILRLCWLWRNRELVWDIVRGKFSKQLLSVFFRPNGVINYVYKGRSICSVLVNMQHHEVVQFRVSRCWDQKRLPPLLSWKRSFNQLHWLLAWWVTVFPE